MATHLKEANPLRKVTRFDKGRRPDIEAELSEKYHVSWTYIPEIKTNAFDLEKSKHNQARFTPIDEKVVTTYSEAAKRGDVFPAVIAWKPPPVTPGKGYVIIDGNHRLVSHDRVDMPLGLYEIDSKTDARIIALMTFAFNTKHGMATSEQERVHQAIYLVDNGASAATAAAAVNLPERIVKRAILRSNADIRADEVGLRRNEWDSLAVTVRAKLSNIATDEGFADAAKLAFAAKLNSDEVVQLVSLLNATKSGIRQRALVTHQSEVMQERIQKGGGGALTAADRKSMNPKQRLALALAQTLALPEDDRVLVAAYAVTERPLLVKRLGEAVARLQRLSAQMDSDD